MMDEIDESGEPEETVAPEAAASEADETFAPEETAGELDEIATPEAAASELDETEEDAFTAREEEAPAATASVSELVRDIEAVLFISPEPVTLEVLAEVTEVSGEELAHAVEAVREKYSDPGGGIAFAEVAGGYTFRSSDAARPAVERFCARPVDYSLSAAAMETVAIIAYLQPITRPEVARIRGVGADTVVANLMDKGLVEEAGRHPQSGAVKYRTTPAFEKLFGLTGLGELPSLDGFEATARDVEELREKLYTAAEKRSSGTPY